MDNLPPGDPPPAHARHRLWGTHGVHPFPGRFRHHLFRFWPWVNHPAGAGLLHDQVRHYPRNQRYFYPDASRINLTGSDFPAFATSLIMASIRV